MDIKIRGYIAMILVIAFVSFGGFMAISPYIFGLPPDDYTEHLKTFGAPYSGIIGIILGYYMRVPENRD